MIENATQIRLAVIKDDLKSLKKLLVNKESLSLRFGRFPLLSLAYLYQSERVISEYERILSKITDYVEMEESSEDYALFKKKAKKSLRFYLGGQVVTPLEMSAIMDDGEGVRALVKGTLNTERVQKIYKVTHSKIVKKKGNGIVVPRSKKPKMRQLTAVLTIIALSVVFICGGVVALELVPVALGGEGTLESPLKITSETLLSTAFDDESMRYYQLENSLNINLEKWERKELKSHVDCLNNEIIIDGTLQESFISKLSGSLSNATIKFKNVGRDLPLNGAFFANEISGKLSNVTFVFEDLNVTIHSECGLVFHTSTGTISNVTLFANGTINEVSALEETVMGALTYKNAGTIDGVSSHLNLTLKGDASGATSEDSASSFGDAVFGGVVGINNGTLTGASVTEGSSIVSDTLDVGGIAVANAEKATISNSFNHANITQSTQTSYWSPNIGGITMKNYGKISSSANYGALSGATNQNKQNTSIILGGITTTNSGTIDKAENHGTLTASMLSGALNVGGMGYLNEGSVTNSRNYGEISVTVNETEAYKMEHHVAGAFAVNNGNITSFRNDGNITGTFSVESSAYVGGVVGLNYHVGATIKSSQNRGNITVDSPQANNRRLFIGGISSYLVGTLNDCFNMGEFQTSSNEKAVVFGAIIGCTTIESDIMGNLYKSNSDWKNNYYLSDKGYLTGIGIFNVVSIFGTNQYMAGEDTDTNATDLETLKGLGVYWE